MISVRNTMVPHERKVEIDIPEEYVNKEVEIVIMPVERKGKTNKLKFGQSIQSLQGILGEVKYTPRMKKEAWEIAVEEKLLSS